MFLFKEPVESSGKRRLYEVIQGRGPKAFVNLCQILNDTSNKTALRILEQNSRYFVLSIVLVPNFWINSLFIRNLVLPLNTSY